MERAVFKSIGMTDYEIDIFLALTKNGPMSVYEISQKTGLYRQVCYDSLSRLQEKGFASFVLKNGKKIFHAIAPEKILEFLEGQKRQYEAMLPELLKMRSFGRDDISVEVFKGKNIVRISLRDIVDTLKEKGGEVLCTAVDESIALQTEDITIMQYERDALHYKIRERVIIKEGSKGLLRKGTSKYAYIAEKYFNPNPVLVYANKVQIVLWGNPNYLVIIENANIADSFRKQFELMWKIARK